MFYSLRTCRIKWVKNWGSGMVKLIFFTKTLFKTNRGSEIKIKVLKGLAK